MFVWYRSVFGNNKKIVKEEIIEDVGNEDKVNHGNCSRNENITRQTGKSSISLFNDNLENDDNKIDEKVTCDQDKPPPSKLLKMSSTNDDANHSSTVCIKLFCALTLLYYLLLITIFY